MPHYIVIDTCCWKNLISKAYYNSQLDQILLWVRQGDLTFLVSDALREEWEKHRRLEMKDIEKKVKIHGDRLTNTRLFGFSDVVPSLDYDEAEKNLIRQVEVVDTIFNLGVPVEETDETKIIVYDHRRKRLAPFHVKMESDNDAIMIFTAMAYINGVSDQDALYFITGNSTDFASTDKPDACIPPGS